MATREATPLDRALILKWRRYYRRKAEASQREKAYKRARQPKSWSMMKRMVIAFVICCIVLAISTVAIVQARQRLIEGLKIDPMGAIDPF